MNYIQLKYKGLGVRTTGFRAYGFMGLSKSPMGDRPLKVAGEYLKAGTLTSAFQLSIPPNGECQVVDCQHNRERLRTLTKPYKRWEEIRCYDEKKGEYYKERKNIEYPASFEVIDDTPIDKDFEGDIKLTESDEVAALKAKITVLEGKKGKKPEASKPKPEVKPEPPKEMTETEKKASRFLNKVKPQ